jgi:hypothetical protein
MRSQGITQDMTFRELLTRLNRVLAMTEATYVEAKRRGAEEHLPRNVVEAVALLAALVCLVGVGWVRVVLLMHWPQLGQKCRSGLDSCQGG